MKNRWTIDDVKRTGLKVDGVETVIAPAVKVKSVKKVPAAIAEMCLILHAMGIEYELEYRFHDLRKFRFDIAIPAMKIGIEYEGLMSEKSRHTTIEGFTMDCFKYNLAQLNGWKVLRYTAKNYADFGSDIHIIINHDKVKKIKEGAI
jgi:hypothetical protein